MLVHRPWGTYETLLDYDNYKVKRIIILPQQQISLQYHNDREEHWTIVSGSGTVEIVMILSKQFLDQDFL